MIPQEPPPPSLIDGKIPRIGITPKWVIYPVNREKAKSFYSKSKETQDRKKP